MGLSGFGGVLPWMHRVLVDRKGWLTEHEYVGLLALSQVLPGPNVCNLALVYGERCFGWRGAAAAMAGLVGLPLFIALIVAAVYAQIATNPALERAMHGMAAVAAGLVISVALRMCGALPRSIRTAMILIATSVAIGVMRWPLVNVVAVLAPISVALAWPKRSDDAV